MKDQERLVRVFSSLTDGQIQHVIREMDGRELYLALRGLPDQVRERFVQNLERIYRYPEALHPDDMLNDQSLQQTMRHIIHLADRIVHPYTIAIASDHAGFPLKQHLKEFLADYKVTDFGVETEESVDYPDTGFPAARAVADGTCQRGILICGSGIGMSIVANKVSGVRAALCMTIEAARLSREHNDANILVLPGRFISGYLGIQIADVWLKTAFQGDRHQRRIDKINKYEQQIKEK